MKLMRKAFESVGELYVSGTVLDSTCQDFRGRGG